MQKVLLGIPSSSGLIPSEVVMNLLAQKKPDAGVGFSFITRTLIDHARNMMAEVMLNEGYDYLWFVDDDTIPPLDALENMLALDKDIVIPAIPSRKYGEDRLCLFDSTDTTKPLTEFKGTRKIFGGGMACTLIKREVILAIAQKYGAPFKFENIDGIEYHEDTNFCRRANELGFEVWGTTKVTPLHMGETMVYSYDGEYKEGLIS